MKEEIIRKYAELMKELELTGLEIQEEGSSIRLERSTGIPGFLPSPVIETRDNAAADNESAPAEDYETITSPMVGVFYQAPAENADPFVKPGDHFKKGDTLCIIEAMKLMNEVVAEKDGVIKKVCVQNGDTVEYGTVLFLIGK